MSEDTASAAADPDAKLYPRDWLVFGGPRSPDDGAPFNVEALQRIGDPPSWRGGSAEIDSKGGARRGPRKGSRYVASDEAKRMVTAALILRRPLLVTGDPGCGKTSLAYAVAHELGLGPVLHWPVDSRSTVRDGLYRYDAIGRLQDQKNGDTDKPRQIIHRYLQLGPVGTAFFGLGKGRPDGGSAGSDVHRPRVLLIDEVDKGDVDLPNDLLHLFEEQYFEIPELARIADADNGDAPFDIRPFDHGLPDAERWYPKGRTVPIPHDGLVRCKEFPLVIMTSNGEREFPPAFRRRCLQLHIAAPEADELREIVELHFSTKEVRQIERACEGGDIGKLINEFIEARRSQSGALGSDQLLNACQVLLGLALREIKTDERKEPTTDLWGEKKS